MALATNGKLAGVERYQQLTLTTIGAAYEVDIPGDAMWLHVVGSDDVFFALADEGASLDATNARRVRLSSRFEDWLWLGGAALGSETPADRKRVTAYLAGTASSQLVTVAGYR